MKMAVNDGNAQAREWADWCKKSKRVPQPVADRIEDPTVIGDFMAGGRPQLADNARDQQRALKILEHLRGIRQQDPASFDAMLGGVTQERNLLAAFIDHRYGRRYQRGLKREEELTGLERYSMGLPLGRRSLNRLRQHGRPIG